MRVHLHNLCDADMHVGLRSSTTAQSSACLQEPVQSHLQLAMLAVTAHRLQHALSACCHADVAVAAGAAAAAGGGAHAGPTHAAPAAAAAPQCSTQQ